MNLEIYKELGWTLYRSPTPPFIYFNRSVGQYWISVKLLSESCGIMVGVTNCGTRLWFNINNINFVAILLDIVEEFIASNEVGKLMRILAEEEEKYNSCCTTISTAEDTLDQLLLGGFTYESRKL